MKSGENRRSEDEAIPGKKQKRGEYREDEIRKREKRGQ